MKIALCDDDKQELLLLTALVEEYSSSLADEDKIEIKSFGGAIELLNQTDRAKNFDLYILDIIMPALNGIQLATEIRSWNKVAKIIFLTSSPEFAVASYSVDAFHYLLKPIQKDKLFQILDKVRLELYGAHKQYLVVKTATSLSKILLHRLSYVEVKGRTLFFHQTDGSVIESNTTISQVEALLLNDSRFLKPHRSFIVNLDCVKHLAQDHLITTNDNYIPISRNQYKEVKETYINFSFQA